MKNQLLTARRYGYFAIRGVIFAQSLSARDELAVALIQLKRDSRRAARAAMDYLASGGSAGERPTVEERERLLGLIRAHVAGDIKGLKEWQKARNGLGVIKGAAGPASGRSSFSRSPRASEPPHPRAIDSSASAPRPPAPKLSHGVPRPRWFGLCPQRPDPSLPVLGSDLVRLRLLVS